MKKMFMLLMLLISLTTTAFAAVLEDDRASMKTAVSEETATVELAVEPSVQRYVFIFNRLNGQMEEFVVTEERDYLPIVTELDQGDLVATVDDRVKLNLPVQVKRYSEKSVTRKLALVPITFKHLTEGEQLNHANMEKYSMYMVEECPVQGQSGPIIIDNQAGLENVSYFVNMLTQLKMVD